MLLKSVRIGKAAVTRNAYDKLVNKLSYMSREEGNHKVTDVRIEGKGEVRPRTGREGPEGE